MIHGRMYYQKIYESVYPSFCPFTTQTTLNSFRLESEILDFVLFCLFVWVEALCPSQQFFSHVGTEPPLPGYYQYKNTTHGLCLCNVLSF